MMMLIKEIRKRIPKLYETEMVPVLEKVVVVKFFDPCGSWTWYAVEFDQKDTFFGLVDGLELEWGYFSLGELKSVKNKPFGLGIERDLYFTPKKTKNIDRLKGRI